jgi:hypothetical protein
MAQCLDEIATAIIEANLFNLMFYPSFVFISLLPINYNLCMHTGLCRETMVDDEIKTYSSDIFVRVELAHTTCYRLCLGQHLAEVLLG